MSTNVFCDLCAQEVGTSDAFIVDDSDFVRAFHFTCGDKIQTAMVQARGPISSMARATERSSKWRDRETLDRLDALEESSRRIISVWRLWLNDAGKGAINPGTFDTMRSLLGMDRA